MEWVLLLLVITLVVLLVALVFSKAFNDWWVG
jgi:hypothetical protein